MICCAYLLRRYLLVSTAYILVLASHPLIKGTKHNRLFVYILYINSNIWITQRKKSLVKWTSCLSRVD